MSTFSTSGYAPRVPRGIDLTTADEYTLLSVIRDNLQNGSNPTRANMAFGLLAERLAIPEPDLPLDPEPYGWTGSERRSTDPRAADSIYGHISFMPRWGYTQDYRRYQ